MGKEETGCHCNEMPEINNSKKTTDDLGHGFSLWSAGPTAGPMTRYEHPGRKVWWAEESCPPHSSQEAKTLRPFQSTHPGDPLSPTGPVLQFLPPPCTGIINSFVDLSID